MDNKFNLLAAILIFASLMMGQSITVVTESHSHDQKFEHSNIEENHREADHDHSVVDQDLSLRKSSKTKNPVHEHSFLKISSLKVVGGTLFRYPSPYQAVNKSVTFSFPDSTFDSVSLSTNLRPPIFA
jgi:hypothetical protein